jgi:hypothetical protein
MKQFLVTIATLVFAFTAQAQLYDGFYSSNNNPKAKGLNFTIGIPKGFDSYETVKPNMVKKWGKEIGSETHQVVITVKYSDFKDLSKKELSEVLQSEGVIQYLIEQEVGMIDSNPSILNAKLEPGEFVYIDQCPGFTYEASFTVDVAKRGYSSESNKPVYMHNRLTMVYLFYEEYMFGLTVGSTIVDNSNEYEFSSNDSVSKLAAILSNTITFTDQYE